MNPTWVNDLSSIMLAAAPLVFAVVGETITEKSGVVNLSLDGSIMLSAMTGFAVASETGSLAVGFLAAAAVSMVVALIVAFASIRLRLNQIAVGFVLFQLTTDLSTFLGEDYVGTQGPFVGKWSIPLLADIPWLGPIFFEQDLMVYCSYVIVLAAWWFIFHTRRGLALRAVGERPEAAHSRGIAVNRSRYVYAGAGGALVGVAGAAYSLDAKIGWSHQPTRNLGWIALAIVIFGGWHPIRAAIGAYLFAGLQTVATHLQGTFPSLSQVLPSIPFPLMIFTLLIVSSEWLRRLTDRVPTLRALLASEPPSAMGTVFKIE
jgi:simple sugar transport system permease protein